MTDTPWTPGPWGDSRKVVLLRGASWLGFANYESAEAEANARLIAAAPDMADVLEEISAALHQIARDRDLWETELAFMRRVDAALAKARGQS